MLSIYYFSYVHLKILRLIKKDSNKKKNRKRKIFRISFISHLLRSRRRFLRRINENENAANFSLSTPFERKFRSKFNHAGICIEPVFPPCVCIEYLPSFVVILSYLALRFDAPSPLRSSPPPKTINEIHFDLQPRD